MGHMMQRSIIRLLALSLTLAPTVLATAQRGDEAQPFAPAYIPLVIIIGLGILLLIPSFKNSKRTQTE